MKFCLKLYVVCSELQIVSFKDYVSAAHADSYNYMSAQTLQRWPSSGLNS